MLIASFQTWKSRSSSSFLQAALRIFPHWAFYLTLKWHTLIGPPSKRNLFNSLLDFRGKTGFVLHTLIVLLFLRHHRRSFCSNILQHVGSILTHTGRQTCLTLSLSVCYSLSHSLTFCSSCCTNPGFPLQTYYPALLYSTSLRLETHANFKCHHTATHTHLSWSSCWTRGGGKRLEEIGLKSCSRLRTAGNVALMSVCPQLLPSLSLCLSVCPSVVLGFVNSCFIAGEHLEICSVIN